MTAYLLLSALLFLLLTAIGYYMLINDRKNRGASFILVCMFGGMAAWATWLFIRYIRG